jgi:predicted porin
MNLKKLAVPAALALALATPAMAQSTVTLYGLVDLNVSNTKAGSRAGGASITTMTDGTVNGLNGSRWGLRTTEDLGGGLKAGIVAESGFNADTGSSAQGGRLFGRQVFVSLSSAALGELRLGRQYAVHDTVMSYTNPFSNGLVLNPGIGVTNPNAVAGNSGALPQFIDAPRIDNVVQYNTPVFGGFGGTVQWAPGENVNDRFNSVMVSFARAPFAAALSHEWNHARVAGATGSRTNKVTTLGANYDFGAVKLFGGWQRGDNLTTASGNVGALTNLIVTGPVTFTANELDVYTVGASMPFGAVTLGVNYTRTEFQGAAGGELSLGKIGVGARYALSNRSYLYTAVSVANGDLKDYITAKRVFQAGIRHAF